MALSAGTRLGPYEILAPIGAGGMGQVYKARDTRLDRIVAIKVLPADKFADPERKQRFRQEAKAASSLNHPNIITIYDIGSEDGVDYLAMEFVAGKTLDQLTPRNGMRIGELLGYAAQVADALAKAHQAGIVHRDLKPTNVMVTSEGLVKVLDFGLAKLTQPATGEDAETQTMAALTGDGAIVGTTYYMSPEQAEAKPVDGRSDIFAFGTILYEMATGQRPFNGQSQIAVLSAILREEPKAIIEIRPEVPSELMRVIARCMRKDPARRFQHMEDLKVALVELKEESDSGTLSASTIAAAIAVPAASPGRKRIWIAAVAVLVMGGAIAGWWLTRGAPSMPDASYQPIPLTSYRGTENEPSFSPDGNQVAFSWDGEKEGTFDIYVKLIGPGTPLRLTNDPAGSEFPRWSPDGRSIAFLRGSEQKYSVFVVPALGGPERRVGTYASILSGAGYPLPSLCWTPDSKALIMSANEAPGQPNSLVLVSLESGATRALTHPALPMRGDMRPAVSPDGRSLAFVRTNGTIYDPWLLPMAEGFLPQGEPKQLPAGGLHVLDLEWIPDGRELLVSAHISSNIGALYRLPVSGSATPQVVPGLGTGAGDLSLSLQGHRLAYAAGTQDSNIWKVDLNAKSAVRDENLSSTFRDAFPQYSPDGKRVTFFSSRAGKNDIWVANTDGTQAARLTSMEGPVTASPRWSPDGQQIAFDSNSTGKYQVYTVSVDGGQPRQLTKESENFTANWSRDGRWIYFASNRGGDLQVWKMPAQGGDAVQVTHGGGIAPTESPDGKTLYFTKDSGTEGVWKMPAEGGPETRVIPDVSRYNYAVTEKGIYFATDATRDRSAIQFLNFATGMTTQVVKADKPQDLGLTVSPDGRTLLYSQLDSYGRDLMLVENFH
jgi:eukaryotic-like serine/threonine-protein kinase